MVSFDGTDMDLVVVANEAQRIADKADIAVDIVFDNEIVTCAIPHTTDSNILLAQLKHLRNEEEDK